MFRLINYYVSPIVITLFLIAFNSQAHAQPSVTDENLEVQTVVSGISLPTDISFIGPNDLLVLEQYSGKVQRINNSQMLPMPLLDVNVSNVSERGLLGIDVLAQSSGHPFIFLYYTEAQSKDGGKVLANRLYRYTFVDDLGGGKLVNRTLLLDLPAVDALPDYPKGEVHNGGKVTIGPDGNIYLTIGDVGDKTKATNYRHGHDANGSGGILRVSPDGGAVGSGILGSSHALDKYYAYGIRNSFGIDFDSVTGYLWDTENGPSRYDEINLVNPGFNSGWHSIMGFIANKNETDHGLSEMELLTAASRHISSAIEGLINGNETAVNRSLQIARGQMEGFLPDLYDFNGRGVYSDPEFTWRTPVAPTALRFYNSSELGEKYLNRIFIGEFQTGNILSFSLNSSRTGLDLSGNLADRTVNIENETDSVLFGKGFGGITDIEVGPVGYLYIEDRNGGMIYKGMRKSIAE